MLNIANIRAYCNKSLVRRGTSLLVILFISAISISLNAQSTTSVCSGSAFSFTVGGAPAGTTYTWAAPTISPVGVVLGGSANAISVTSVSQTLSLTGTAAPATATYTVTPSTGSAFQLIVTINPLPVLNSTLTPAAVCSGSAFNYSPSSTTTGTGFAWTRAVVGNISNTAGSGSGNISETLNNTSTSPVSGVNYLYVLTANGCSSPAQTVTVTVNPKPVLSSTTSPSANCSGILFNYTATSATPGTTFAWSRSLVTNISNSAGSGSGNISENLVSTSTSAVTVPYVYTLTANGCSNAQTVNATVSPTPSVSAQLVTTCTGNSFTITPTGVPAGTQYTWAIPTYSPLASLNNGTSGTNQNNITQALTALTANTATATYLVTPVSGVCTGSVFNVTATVNPLPTLTSSSTPSAICSNTVFSYIPVSSVTGSTFAWTRAIVIGISNVASSGTGNISETLINTTTAPVSVVYQYTITSPSGCVSTIQTVTVTVNPSAVLSSSLTPSAICSGTIFNYTPLSVTAGFVATWTRASQTSISNASSSGTGNPAEILINTSTNAVTVSYIYTITANGCSNSQTVNVVVNPAPSVPAQATTICTGSAFTVLPSGAGVPTGTQYTWSAPILNPLASIGGSSAQAVLQNSISQTLTNATGNNATATYTVTPVTNGCTGANFVVTITVNPSPTLSSTLTPTAICSNTIFSYTATSAVAGTTFAWTRATVAGISNAAGGSTGNPSETLVNTSSAPVSVSYIFTLTTPGGCVNSQTVVVTVNPLPVFTSSLTPTAVCSGVTFNYTAASVTTGTTYTWTRNTVTNISNAAGSGVTNISESLVNTAIVAVSVPYTYILTANGCSNTQIVTATINPAPSVINQTATICNNTAFSVSPTGVPTGTQYTWTAPVLNPALSITGSSAVVTLQSSIGQTLVNTTSNNATATYTVTPSANGCTGASFTIAVTVNPNPVLSSSATPAAVCSNSVFSYTPTNSVAGTTFIWTRAIVAGISNTAGNGTGNPNETLINITTAPISVIYIYTLTTPAGCVNTQTVTVSVNPSPILSSSSSPSAVCSGVTFNYTASSATAGTTFAWTRAAVAGISNTAGSGTTSISEALVNTGIVAVAVPYTYILTANGCSNSQVVTVSINPSPSVTNQSTTICNNTAFTIAPTNVPIGTTYSWTTPTYSPLLSIAGGSAQAGQTSISQTLVNSTTNNATATYVVTPLAGTCTGSTFNVSVIVNPSLILSSSTSPAAICSNAVFSYSPTSATAGASFAWARTSVTGISNGPANGTGNPNETLINTTAQAVSVPYTFTLTSLNGCVSSQTVTVPVNPSPTISSLANPAAVCSGSAFTYLATSATTGTSFSWTRAQLATINNAASSGVNATINEALINSTTAAVSVPYIYTLTANGCSNTQTVTATINPTPVVANQTAVICSGSAFTITPANVPSTTTYAWTSPVISPLGSVNGGSALSGQTSISQVLNNITSANGTATYTVTPSAGTCTGTSFTIAVTVNPIPTLTSTLTPTAICSNTTFNYTPASNTTGSILSWTRSVVTGISNAAASGLNNPAETLVNITTQSLSVPYLYTITTPNGCSTTQTVTVVVNPSPSLTSGLTPNAICSGSVFSYTPTSATTGTTYSWVRSAVTSISNASATGNGNVSETLVNTSIVPVDVLYTYTNKANGCNNVQVVTVTVNPTPVSSNLTTTTCSNSAFTVTPSNVPVGTQYTWATPSYNPASSITGGSLQSTAQSSISQTLTNQTINNAFATYTVTPSANGCTGVPFSLVVTLNASPVIANQIIAPVCSGIAFSYAATGVPTATTYTWSNPVQSPLNSLTGASAQAVNQSTISQILSSTNNISDTAVYTVTPVAGNGCIGNTFTLSVPINPVPVVNNLTDTICSGGTFSVTPSPVPVNTTYTWTTPTTIPTGIVVGGKSQVIATPSISQTLTNSSTTSAAQAIYTITPSTAGCKGASFTLVETVGVPLANITNKIATICSGTAFDVTPVAPANTKYTWTIPTINPAGSVAGSSAASLQTKVSQTISNLGAVKSSAVYTVQPSNTGCIGNSFTATITVLPVPKATITGSTSVCYYPLDTLSVNFDGTAPWSFSYTDNNIPFTVTGITSSPYQLLLPALPGVTTRTVAITLANDATCVDSINKSTIVQTVNPLPTGQIISLHGTYMCNGIPDTLFVKYPATDTLSFLWTLNGVSVPGVTTDSVATLTTGRYNVIMTNQFGCVDTTANPVTLTLIPPPVTNFSYSSYCVNNLINFTNLTDTTFTGPVSWLWDMGDGITTTTFNAADIYTSGGARRVRLTATPFYCPAYAVTKDSIIDIQYPIPALRLPSVSAYQAVPTPLAARTLPGYQYLWTPSKGIDKPDSALVNFNNQFTQDYVINLISPAGCVTYDSLLVRVFDNNLVNIMVPKSFTPNGDGNNDVLYPYLAGIKTFQYFKVYNRYGKLMYESTNPDAGWNGYFNGAPQPMGIYIWIAVGIANDGSSVQKKGETLLLR